MLEFVQVYEHEPSVPEELANCLRKNRHHPDRLRFLIYSASEPVGFVAIDLQPVFFLYELYIVRTHRCAGVGSFAITRLNDIARAQSHTTIFVRPHPIDEDIDPERLRGFYVRHGFVPSDSQLGALEKIVS